MITAIDSNILIDVVGADPDFGEVSRSAIDMAAREGPLVISPEVVAEFATGCGSAEVAFDVLEVLKISYVDTGLTAAGRAGEARGLRRTRSRITADYLIATHAAEHADRLLTRDADFAMLGIEGLAVVTPSEILAG